MHRHGRGEVPCVEVGPTVCLRPTQHSSAPKGMVLNTPEADGYGTHLHGFIVAYDWPGHEERLEGAVSVDTCGAFEGARWEMTGSLEGGDLTLDPSIQAYEYVPGDPPRDNPTIHGWVRNGKWVPA